MTQAGSERRDPLLRTCRPGPALLLLATGLLAPGTAPADIYRHVDAHGVVRLADRPLGPGYELVVRSPPPAPSFRPRPGNRERYRALVDEAARRHGVNQALIDAVIVAESGYDPEAVSVAGAVGLMQLMPETARAYGVDDRRDARQNVHAGTRHLRDLLERYMDLELALAAYNAGEGAVARHGNRVPPYPETRGYVAKVTQLFHEGIARRDPPAPAGEPPRR